MVYRTPKYRFLTYCGEADRFVLVFLQTAGRFSLVLVFRVMGMRDDMIIITR